MGQSRAQIAESIRKELAAIDLERQANRIYHFREGGLWRPNPAQAKLLEAWEDSTKKVFSFCGANRIGKCVSYQTLIDTPDGGTPVGVLYERGEPFNVYSWDGGQKVIVKAKPPFKKDGLHKCYRIGMKDGRIIEAADRHRILNVDGRYVSTEDLFYTYSQSLPLSSLGTCRSVRAEDGQNFAGTQLDCRDDCFVCSRQYDGTPLMEEDTGQVFLPLRGDVQGHDGSLLRKDGRVDNSTNSRQRELFLPSSMDALLHSGGQFFESVCYTVYKTLTSLLAGFQLSPQLSIAGISGLQSGCEVGQHQFFFSGLSSECMGESWDTPFLGVNDIVSITPISPCQEVFDFEVPKYHNYFAGGLVHHNTSVGVIIGLSVLFGEWPWNKTKMVFPHKEPRKVRYVGQGWESHVKTVVEPELKKLWPRIRPVETKKNNQGVEALWKDLQTGSTLEIMSNNQESDTFEGWSGDLIIWDEPPSRNNRIAAARGLVDRQGRELFVATLLKEAWIHREVIKARLPDGSPDLTVFNINADISVNVGYGLTQEGVDQFVKTLRKEEIEARIKGKPSYLGNLVLPNFNRDVHVVNRFKIPLDWIVDISIDFHPSKAWAVLFVATGRDNRKFVCHKIHEKGNPKYIAEEIIRIARANELFVNSITIDPLSKGDENAHIEAETVYIIMEKVFKAYHYRLDTASKDKDNGIALTNDLLMTENEMPALFFFKDLGVVIEQIEDWMYDPETLKPSKENDDFCEVLYRIVLRNTQWADPFERDARLRNLPAVDFGQVAYG
jgi:hypothetical protein